MGRNRGSPGPRYLLPGTTGFMNHDPTRPQAPAFSLGVRTDPLERRFQWPGPKYDVRGFNQNGKIETQQNSLAGKTKPPRPLITPAPKNYDLNTVMPTPPSYTFGMKRADAVKAARTTPGANKYVVPTCIGPDIPDKSASPAYSVLGRNFPNNKKVLVPGPKYMLPEIQVYLKTPPRAPMLGRAQVKKTGTSMIPGANKYLPIPTYEQGKDKGYSFGVRHTEEQNICYTAEDRQDNDGFVF